MGSQSMLLVFGEVGGGGLPVVPGGEGVADDTNLLTGGHASRYQGLDGRRGNASFPQLGNGDALRLFKQGVEEGPLVDGISLEVGEGDSILGVGFQVILSLVLGGNGGAGELPFAGHDVRALTRESSLCWALPPSSFLKAESCERPSSFQGIQGLLLGVVRGEGVGPGCRGEGVEGADTAAHTLGQHHGGGFEEGAEVAEAGPPGEGEVVGREEGDGVDEAGDVPGLLEGGGVGDFEYDALKGATSEGDPDAVAGFHFQVARDGIGEGAARLQGGVDGDFSEWHSQQSRPQMPPFRDELEGAGRGVGARRGASL